MTHDPPRDADALLDDLVRSHVASGGKITGDDLALLGQLRRRVTDSPAPDAAEWRAVADASRDRAAEARDRKHRLLSLVPRSDGLVDRSAELAAAETAARALRHADGADAWSHVFAPAHSEPEIPLTATRPVPYDHVAVHADAFLRMQIEHEDVIAALHSARQALAQLMAARGDGSDTRQIHLDLARRRRGLANVAAGRAWGDDG